jgi:hypothetical protein
MYRLNQNARCAFTIGSGLILIASEGHDSGEVVLIDYDRF